MLEVIREDRVQGIILAHTHSPAFVSARSEVLHNVADAALLEHALRKAAAMSWGPLLVLANSRNAASIEKLVQESGTEEVTIVECEASLAPLDAVREGLDHVEDNDGTIAVIPANMPLLEPSDTLLSMEAMLFDDATNAQARCSFNQGWANLVSTWQNWHEDSLSATRGVTESQRDSNKFQVPYVGLLNRSATKHPPTFLADLKWLRSCLKFLQLTREEQDSKEQEPWVLALRKAIGTHYCGKPEKMLIRLCTIGYAVCAAREEDMTVIYTRADLAFAESVMQARLVRKHQLAGVTIRDPAGTFLGVDVIIGIDTELGVGVQIYGKTTIGSLCRIEGPTTILSSRLEDGVFIRSFTTLEGSYVNEGSGAGPYARLREGTELGPNSYLGNFVETKNARIGHNTLACHLTYVGDAEIGSRTNIGAGTITCNYNGVAKNQTRIGDDAFIGSNSTLVAPVKIGKNTVIAAGSVITQAVADNAVAFGRAKQVLKDGYSQTLRLRLQTKQNKAN